MAEIFLSLHRPPSASVWLAPRDSQIRPSPRLDCHSRHKNAQLIFLLNAKMSITSRFCVLKVMIRKQWNFLFNILGTLTEFSINRGRFRKYIFYYSEKMNL